MLWIADSRGLGAVKPAGQQWLHTEWSPRTYAAGGRYIATVEAETIFGKISAQQYVTNVTRSEEYTFHTRYLRSKPPRNGCSKYYLLSPNSK